MRFDPSDQSGVLVVGPCFICKNIFSFHPTRVPSYDPSLDRPEMPKGKQPICSECIVIVNRLRKRFGLEEWEVFPDSYGLGTIAEL